MVPRIQHRHRPGSHRALGICFAALVLFGATAPAHAQSIRRLPSALMPAPGNAGLSLAFGGSRETVPLVTTSQHPLFDTSYTGDVNHVLATTRYGNVTSRDLYLWMLMTDSPNKPYLSELLNKARFPKEREELSKALKAEVDNFVFHNYVIPRIMPSAPADPVYDFKHHVYTLPVWQTVFLEKVVQPTLCITEADRQKYLQEHTTDIVAPQRLRVRYIFMRSPETAAAEEQDRVEVEMDELRASILRGEISFADAARRHSQAPSASRGGEIPPFQHGELFFLFENAAAELEPGGISKVFRGPTGFYIVQLIEVLEPEEPSLSNPAHARKVDEGLSRQVLRSGYDIYMRDMLLERRRIIEKPTAWDHLEEDEALGEVCDFVMSKAQLRSAWPAVEGNDLKLRFDVMAALLRTTLEREAMAQEVRALGHAGDPMLERARWMAGNMIRRDAWMDSLRQNLPISENIVRSFWENNPDLFTPLALKRVIRLTMLPSNTVPLPAQTRMELDQVLARATGQPATIAVQKFVPQDEELHGLVQDVQERTEGAFQMLTNPSSEPDYYTEEYTTDSLQAIIDSASDEIVPSLQGEPAPGMDTIDAPAPVTTDTLNSLVTPTPDADGEPAATEPAPAASSVGAAEDTATTTTVLDLATTSPRGGASPTPAAGGVGPAGIRADREVGAPVTATDINVLAPSHRPVPSPATPAERASTEAAIHEEELAGPPIVGDTKPARPAATPTGGQVPVGITAPALGPLTLKPTPNPQNQLKPPATSAIPYNPDWFYARMDPTEIAAIVGQYASSDWLLKMDDLGFVYVPDLAEAPPRLEKVPVGAFSRPIVRGQAAVSWYIEDARKMEKPSFEQIKTHAYEVYRNVQLDKVSAETYNRELEKAGINYKF